MYATMTKLRGGYFVWTPEAQSYIFTNDGYNVALVNSLSLKVKVIYGPMTKSTKALIRSFEVYTSKMKEEN